MTLVVSRMLSGSMFPGLYSCFQVYAHVSRLYVSRMTLHAFSSCACFLMVNSRDFVFVMVGSYATRWVLYGIPMLLRFGWCCFCVRAFIHVCQVPTLWRMTWHARNSPSDRFSLLVFGKLHPLVGHVSSSCRLIQRFRFPCFAVNR